MPDLVTTLQYPIPPSFTPVEKNSDIAIFQSELQSYLGQLARYEIARKESLIDTLTSGDIESIAADKVIAGTISVDQIYVGSSKFELDGLLTQLRIKDGNGTLRVNIGEFGAGTDAGIKAYKSDGTLLIDISDTVYLDGVIIADNTVSADAINATQLSAITADLGTITAGTITGALIRTSASNPRVEMTSTGIAGYDSGGVAIFDLTTSGTVRFGKSTADNILWDSTAGTLVITGDVITTGNIVNSAVTDAKISSMSFTKLTAGTITTSGVANFTGGADINMTAATGSNNYLTFKNSSGTTKGTITYVSSTDNFGVLATSTANLYLLSAVADVIVATASAKAFRPDSDNVTKCGTTAKRWSDLRSVLINGADYCFENDWRWTEPNYVYKDADPLNGVYLMKPIGDKEWEVVLHITKDRLYFSGDVSYNTKFKKPDFNRRFAPNDD